MVVVYPYLLHPVYPHVVTRVSLQAVPGWAALILFIFVLILLAIMEGLQVLERYKGITLPILSDCLGGVEETKPRNIQRHSFQGSQASSQMI